MEMTGPVIRQNPENRHSRYQPSIKFMNYWILYSFIAEWPWNGLRHNWCSKLISWMIYLVRLCLATVCWKGIGSNLLQVNLGRQIDYREGWVLVKMTNNLWWTLHLGISPWMSIMVEMSPEKHCSSQGIIVKICQEIVDKLGQICHAACMEIPYVHCKQQDWVARYHEHDTWKHVKSNDTICILILLIIANSKIFS